MKKYRIGRDAGPGPLVPAFDIRREDDGRILIDGEQDTHGPTDAERTAILRVMEQPVRAFVGTGDDGHGGRVDAIGTIEPGTLEHFDNAVRRLPLPFYVMPR